MQDELNSIKERNKRVELDKAWEVSKTRKVIICLLTYIIIVIFLISINALNPFINALIPVIGFLLSTLTITSAKRIWIKFFKKSS